VIQVQERHPDGQTGAAGAGELALERELGNSRSGGGVVNGGRAVSRVVILSEAKEPCLG
jgi:hypothetical protein